MQVEENYHKYEARGGAYVDLVAIHPSLQICREKEEKNSGDSSHQIPFQVIGTISFYVLNT